MIQVISELEIYQRNEGIRPVITGYLRVCNVCVCVLQTRGEGNDRANKLDSVDTMLLPLTPQFSYTNMVP